MDETDFEFDFFPESPARAGGDEWGDTAWEEEAPDLHGDPVPERARPPSPQIIMRRRIVAATAVALLLLIILLVAVTQGSGGQGGVYRSYVAGLSPIAADSERVGGSLLQSFTGSQAGSAGAGLVGKLDGFVQQAVSDITRAQTLTPPASLRTEQAQALAALDLRLQALQAIRNTLAQALASQTPAAWITGMSGQVAALIASDLIWENSVRKPISAALQANGIGGDSAPQSRFVAQGNSLLKSMLALLESKSVSLNAQALKLGDKGPAVSSWQTQLNTWLRLASPAKTPLTADGTFGPATQAATQALQTAAGIAADGIVGPNTRQALQAALAGQATPARTG